VRARARSLALRLPQRPFQARGGQFYVAPGGDTLPWRRTVALYGHRAAAAKHRCSTRGLPSRGTGKFADACSLGNSALGRALAACCLWTPLAGVARTVPEHDMTSNPASVLQRHRELSHSFALVAPLGAGAVMSLHALQNGARDPLAASGFPAVSVGLGPVGEDPAPPGQQSGGRGWTLGGLVRT
jgi:hypothetical protein